MEKLWGGRFSKDLNKTVEKFTSSLNFDQRLSLYDLKGSLAHARSLMKIKVLDEDEFNKIKNGLTEILKEISEDSFKFDSSDEDIHMAIERMLTNKIGPLGGKLHTGRSRNDQVVTDLKMYCREEIINLSGLIIALIDILIQLAVENEKVILPGYTHLQRAQPVLLSHHFMAYVSMLKRDIKRLQASYQLVNSLPLGAGALAGTGFNVNREEVAEELGFEKVSENSLDAVSDRDFVLELHSILNIIMIHLSRLSEEIILWSSSEFNFIVLDDSYSTGSSMMPQKKNPDVAELIRGKTGRITGNLIALSMVMKGLPLAYNRDLQEDKEGLFESMDIVEQSVLCLTGLLQTMEINEDSMQEAVDKSFVLATELADYLTEKGLSFRDAHTIVGRIVSYCLEKELYLDQLPIKVFQEFSDVFDDSLYEYLKPQNALAKKKIKGGTSPHSVKIQIENSKKWLDNVKPWLDGKLKISEKIKSFS